MDELTFTGVTLWMWSCGIFCLTTSFWVVMLCILRIVKKQLSKPNINVD